MVNLFLRLFLFLLFIFPFNNCKAQKNAGNPNKKSRIDVQDSTVTVFYDAHANILGNQKDFRAKYYRVIQYRDGNLFGPVKDYFINGNVYMIGYYTNNIIAKGYENGVFSYFYENGMPFQIRHYVNGLLDGIFIEYYPSGAKKSSVSFSNDKPYGCQYSWDENGRLTGKGFFENNQLYNRVECDTVQSDQNPVIGSVVVDDKSNQKSSEPGSISFQDAYNNEYPDGGYKIFENALAIRAVEETDIPDNPFNYKANGLQLISISLTDDQGASVSSKNIKPAQHFYVRIYVEGLKSHNGTFKYILAQSLEDSNGLNYGSTGDVKSEGTLEPLLVELGGGIRALPNNINSEDFYFSFKIKDRNSDNIIHGFFKFTVVN